MKYDKKPTCGGYCPECGTQSLVYGIEKGSFIYDCFKCEKRIEPNRVVVKKDGYHAFINFHGIEVVYTGPTNSRGSRVILTSHRLKERVTISYDYSKNDIVDMAREYLESKGHDIIGMCESKKGYMVLSRTFKGLKA